MIFDYVKRLFIPVIKSCNFFHHFHVTCTLLPPYPTSTATQLSYNKQILLPIARPVAGTLLALAVEERHGSVLGQARGMRAEGG